MEQTAQQRTYRSLCCTWYDAYVPAWHFTDGDVALLTEQARGPGTVGLRREQAPVLCTPAMANDHTIQRTCDDTASWPPRRPADGQQRAALRERVTGHQEGSWGLISLSRRMYSTAPVRGLSSWCLRVSLKSTSAQQVSSLCLRAKDLEGTKVAVFPRNWGKQKVQTGSAAAGGHRRVATRKTTGDLATRRGAGDPERRAGWMTVSRYLRSAPVVVNTHGVRTACTPCNPGWSPCARHGRLLHGLLPLPDEQNTSALPRRCVVERFSFATRPETGCELPDD